MAAKTLASFEQIREARRELERLGASCLDPRPIRWLRRFGIPVGHGIGDPLKSWDVLQTLLYLRDRLPPNAPIVDIGAFASEILHSLLRVGYSDLVGVDLNPALLSARGHEQIRYLVSDFMETPLPAGSASAVTAISVIEHGFRPRSLFPEISRLLVPGGYFVASFDYWPEKIDTSGIRFFDMDWTVFSGSEVRSFVELASEYGLHPPGPLDLSAADRSIRFLKKEYTFCWLVLQKA